MSEHDPHREDEGPGLAAEHALGVLDAEGRREAGARIGTDAAFRADLRAWEDRLAPLADEVAPVEAPASVWPRVEASTSVASLDEAREMRAERRGGLWNSLNFWRAGTAAGVAVAALAITFAITSAERTVVVTPPTVSPTEPMMVAELTTRQGAPMLVVAYDPGRKMALLTPMPGHAAPSGHGMELWLIPADGRPRSLGMISSTHPKPMLMRDELDALMRGQVTLAITVEVLGGSPTGQPTTTPVATGQVARL